MKTFLLFLLCITMFVYSNVLTSQTIFNFTDFEKQVCQYKPKQKSLTKKDYDFAVMILSETKKAVDNRPENFNRADYFNILTCLITLQESEAVINIAYEKFEKSEGSCEYFLDNSIFKSKRYDVIRNKIEKQVAVCKQTGQVNSFDIKEYATDNKLDYTLVNLLKKIDDLDRKYRKASSTDWSKQKPIDRRNQQVIDSLFAVHGQYLGLSMVGEKYKHVMWLIIQHSNLEMMEKYVPHIHKAVQHNELDASPFKMLIDRIYTRKYGYQIFGSQQGVDLADEKIRQEVILEYMD